MEKTTLEQIKANLLERKAQIEKELDDVTRDNGTDTRDAKFPEYGTKQDDNASEIDQYTTKLATEKVLESALRDVNSALDRIAKGTYGICKYCGKEIGEKRLLARPVASACVECKTKIQNLN